MRTKLNITEGIFPMPVLMVATYNEDGSVNVMNAAWGTMQERDTVALNLKAREDCPLLVHIQRNRNVCFSVLCSHLRFSHSCSLIPVYAGMDDLRQHKCLSI